MSVVCQVASVGENEVALALRALANVAPPPKLTVSEWADRYRFLSRRDSAKPGKWRPEPHQTAIMDAFSDPAITDIVVMAASQVVGKSQMMNNGIGYFVHQDPSNMLVMHPTLAAAEKWAKGRLDAMIESTPAVAEVLPPRRVRDGDNTILHRQFRGGQLFVVGSNAPADLAAQTVRCVWSDEVDRYESSAGEEGDPLELADQRTIMYGSFAKRIKISTPLLQATSRILRAYEETDRRVWEVRCPDCGAYFQPAWRHVVWEKHADGHPVEGTARMTCDSCGAIWGEGDRLRAIEAGRWRATAPFRGAAGFWINALGCRPTDLDRLAKRWHQAQGNPERLKAFVNLVLAEPWREAATTYSPETLEGRKESWGRYAPEGVLVVTCGVDVQDDRIEVERVGWGVEEESWSLDYRVIYGDPTSSNVWRDLNEYLLTPTHTIDGRELQIGATAVDSGAHTQQVYKFVRDKVRRRIWAIKGVAGQGKPAWPARASRNNTGRVNLFLVGVDTCKDVVLGRIAISEPGPGYMHVPADRDPTWAKQLTAERAVVKYVKGFAQKLYEKDDGARNEALDVRNYAYAALCSLKVVWSREVARARLAPKVPVEQIEADEPPPVAAEPAPEVSRIEVEEQARVSRLRALGRRGVGRSGFMGR